mmetsp:Transcript_87994/g.222080  ORF Transcript_87994/g.222080 Transcript_87994/m.222080 type:complete len:224 (+) Transcript_87994:958-1629(+)
MICTNLCQNPCDDCRDAVDEGSLSEGIRNPSFREAPLPVFGDHPRLEPGEQNARCDATKEAGNPQDCEVVVMLADVDDDLQNQIDYARQPSAVLVDPNSDKACPKGSREEAREEQSANVHTVAGVERVHVGTLKPISHHDNGVHCQILTLEGAEGWRFFANRLGVCNITIALVSVPKHLDACNDRCEAGEPQEGVERPWRPIRKREHRSCNNLMRPQHLSRIA